MNSNPGQFRESPPAQRIIVAVCGGIAAYKTAELVRLLRQQQCEVQVVMTHTATEFITPLTFQALSGHPVHSELLNEATAMAHIQLARWADKIVIAPATANIIAKLSCGLADELVSTLCLAANCPIYLAPAMNLAMWHKAVTQENLQRLQQHGMIIIEPESGELACGEIGVGRMAAPEQICERLIAKQETKHLQGVKILISAGPTREPLDPVRYITNRSSGKMGYALVQAAIQAGAQVTLVSGIVNLKAPENINFIQVETAAEMYQAVISQARQQDIYIGAAAVADYTPLSLSVEKIKSQATETTIILQKTQDILANVALLNPRPFVVGFAAETHELEKQAQDKLQRKKLDMIAANWVGQAQGGFDSEHNALQVFWDNGQHSFAMTTKTQLAVQLLTLISERFYAKKNTTQNFG